jgi:hypothetical protein
LSQIETSLIEGDFQNLPFVEFAEEVESQTGYRFYFLEEWVEPVRVTASGKDIPLQGLLDRFLHPFGINWYLDPWGHLFLAPREEIIAQLPDYQFSDRSVNAIETEVDADLQTLAEQRYINGRKARVIETIEVGSQELAKDEALIHGRMTDRESGESLIGATIYLEELKRGTASDLDGRFHMVIRPGTYTAEINCMGMEQKQYHLHVYSGGNLFIAMDKRLVPIDEVVIQADKYHNVRGSQMGFERLNREVFKDIPLVMGERDLLKIIQMLPGVQSAGEGSGGFYVRGGGADQNMIYINKVPVYNSSHLFGFFTSFNPDVVRDFTLYKSNLPAKFGGRMASVVDITARQGNLNKYSARGGISPVTCRLAVDGPIQQNKSSFFLGMRTTYSDWMLKYMEDPDLRKSEAGFYDVSAALKFEPAENTTLKVFAYMSQDRFKFSTSQEYAYSNSGASMDLNHRFNQRTSADVSLVYGKYSFHATDRRIRSDSYTHAYDINHLELKGDFSRLSMGSHKITYGGSVIYHHLDRGRIEPYGDYSYRNPLDLGIENGLESGIYVADEISLTPRFTLYGGLRLVNFLAMGPSKVLTYAENQSISSDNVTGSMEFGKAEVFRSYFAMEPRVSLNYLLGGNNSFKFSYNRIHQYLFMLSNTLAISPTDQWKMADYHIVPPHVDQLSLGYYRDFPSSGLSASIELYSKWIAHAVAYRDGADFLESPHMETEILQGRQKAHGVESMIRKRGGRLTGWLAYSYSKSRVRVNSPIRGEQINQGLWYPSNVDRPHNLTFVANLKMSRRLSFSSNLVYYSGRPVTYPVSIYYSNQLPYIHYSKRNSYNIPDYFRLDLSLNLEGTLKRRKLFHSYWSLNVYNFTGRQNAYSVYFVSDGDQISGKKLSIYGRQVISLSWNFKLGNYASE